MAQLINSKYIGEAYSLLHNGILALSDAEQQGMRVDVKYIEKKKKEIDDKIKELETKIYESSFYAKWKKYKRSTINIYSDKQLASYLYGSLNIEPKKLTQSGGGSTDEETLASLHIYEIDLLLEIKKLKTIKTRYLAGFVREQVDGFIHPFFNLHLARTYRGSSDRPNFQNIPIRDKEAMNIVRGALFPRVGNQILEMDFKQLEVCIAACYHQDPTMLDYIEHGKDMHKDMAIEIFDLSQFDPIIHGTLRKAAKNGFVFPQFYGDYYVNNAKTLAQEWCKLTTGNWRKGQGIQVGEGFVSDILLDTGIRSYNAFVNHLQVIERNFWSVRFPVYDKWKETWWNQYQKDGYFLSKTGFIFQGVMSRNDATNYPVQGAAFHVLLWCLIRLTKLLKEKKMKSRIIGQIHDSIVFDIYPPELQNVIEMAKRVMERDVRKHWDWIIVPLTVDAGLCPVDGSWAQKEDYKI